jgi:Flp pilus assembly protein TadG
VTNLFPTQKQNLKRFGRSDEGQALVLTALALTVLMLMAGMGVDVGYLRYQKQQMQRAADAGALAGASARAYNGAWKAAAVADVNANGFTTMKNDGTSTGVTILVDKPWEGPFAGQAGYVEVSVSQPQPTFFMKVFLPADQNTVPVRSWAVASAVAPGSGCIYAMDPNSDPGTFLVNGSVTISSTCAIYVNSSNSSALTKLGNSGTIKASYIGIVGECSANGSIGCAPPAVVSDLSSGQMPVTHIAPVNDPLANVCPTTASCPELIPSPTCASPTGNGKIYSQGTYCGTISLGSTNTYTFNPGVYILLGGLSVSGSPIINGTGVTFYNTYNASHPYGGITMTGSPTVTLSAPTTGDLAGMLFFQDRRVPVGSSGSNFKGSSAQGYTGSIYFPTTDITFEGTPSLSSTATIMLGYKLSFSGNTSIENYTYLSTGGGPITGATLAE